MNEPDGEARLRERVMLNRSGNIATHRYDALHGVSQEETEAGDGSGVPLPVEFEYNLDALCAYKEQQGRVAALRLVTLLASLPVLDVKARRDVDELLAEAQATLHRMEAT